MKRKWSTKFVDFEGLVTKKPYDIIMGLKLGVVI